jgi:hypothetical protein
MRVCAGFVLLFLATGTMPAQSAAAPSVTLGPGRTLPLGEVVAAAAAADCQVHVEGVPESCACNVPCPLPDSSARLWVEQPPSITPFLWRAAGDPRRSPTVVSLPLVDAGTITARRPRTPPGDVMFVHVASPVVGGPLQRSFERNVPDREAAAGVPFPVGPAVAAATDRRTHTVTVLSRPIPVIAGKSAHAELLAPKSGSDVFAILERSNDAAGSATPLLTVGERKVNPDVLIDGPDRMVAIWYGVVGSAAALSVTSARLYVVSRELPLNVRGVTNVSAVLKVRPELTVRVKVTGREIPEMKVTLQPSGSQVVTAREAVRPNEPHTFREIEPLTFDVALELGDWRMVKTADLTSGESAAVAFTLEPIHVTGTVFSGARPVQATVGFRGDGKWAEFESDDRGEYHATLWRAQRYLVRVRAADDEPAREPLSDSVKIESDRTLDFHLPDGRIAVKVVDAESHAGIAKAKVAVSSRWIDDVEGRKSTTTPVAVDADGLALLPPSRSGTLEIFAGAPGYLDHAPLVVPIDAGDSRTIELALQPQGAGAMLTLSLPGGAPAAGAEVEADRITGATRLVGTADAAGQLLVPAAPASGLLLVRHPLAATELHPWSDSPEPQHWTLSSPAEPLVVRAETLTGGHPDYGYPIPITLWLGGVKLSPSATAFATWFLATTDNDGLWTARNLPRAAIRIVAGRTGGRTGPEPTDVLAQEVGYPWPATVRIRAIN